MIKAVAPTMQQLFFIPENLHFRKLFLTLWRIPVDAAQYKTQKLNLKALCH